MISLEEYFGLYGLDENEVAAISEHEHIPDIAAAALASYLLTQPHGGETVRTMIIDDIHKALVMVEKGHNAKRALRLLATRHTVHWRTSLNSRDTRVCRARGWLRHESLKN